MKEKEPGFLWSLFLGPQGENSPLLEKLLSQGLQYHQRWRKNLYPDDPSIYPDDLKEDSGFQFEVGRLRQAWEKFLQRMDGNLPYPSVRYEAQMLRDPALPAVLAYWYTLLSNPNNHAYEGGPVTTEMEMEVVERLLALIGFETGWGHLTSGGSLANMESLWAVRDYRKPGKMVFSKGAHYAWKRIASILRVGPFVELPVDARYRMDVDALESELKKGDVMFVVASVGTTGVGAVDPLEEILSLREKYGFHLHADAAYGGYYRSMILDKEGLLKPFAPSEMALSEYVYRQLARLGEVDSVTIDPHKHGLVGYGAGSVLFRDEALRRVILNTAPYTYHVTDKPNIGMFTLEGSRPGAAAAAVWLTLQLLPLNDSGFGQLLQFCRAGAEGLYDALSEMQSLHPVSKPDLDLLAFYRRPQGTTSLREMNEATLAIYRTLSVENPNAPFILSKLEIDAETAAKILPDVTMDADHLTAVRGVFMKPWLTVGPRPTYLELLVTELEKFDEKES